MHGWPVHPDEQVPAAILGVEHSISSSASKIVLRVFFWLPVCLAHVDMVACWIDDVPEASAQNTRHASAHGGHAKGQGEHEGQLHMSHAKYAPG